MKADQVERVGDPTRPFDRRATLDGQLHRLAAVQLDQVGPIDPEVEQVREDVFGPVVRKEAEPAGGAQQARGRIDDRGRPAELCVEGPDTGDRYAGEDEGDFARVRLHFEEDAVPAGLELEGLLVHRRLSDGRTADEQHRHGERGRPSSRSSFRIR